MAGEERSIVSPIPGTTMDSVEYGCIGTMGASIASWIRPASGARARPNLLRKKLSVVMARRGLERADVALLVVDGEQGRDAGRRDDCDVCGSSRGGA